MTIAALYCGHCGWQRSDADPSHDVWGCAQKVRMTREQRHYVAKRLRTVLDETDGPALRELLSEMESSE